VEMKNRFAFVGFYNKRDAGAAIDGMDGKDFEGNKLIVEWTKGQPRGKRGGRDSRGSDRDYRDRQNHNSSVRRKVPPERSDYRVVVSNVPEKCHWTELKDKFREAGYVVFGDVWGSRGVVEFKYEEDMKIAIKKFNKSEWKGYTLRVERDRRKMGSRSPSLNRSRGARSFSGSPARSRSPNRSKNRRKGRRERSRSRSRDGKRDRRRSRSREERSREGSTERKNGKSGESEKPETEINTEKSEERKEENKSPEREGNDKTEGKSKHSEKKRRRSRSEERDKKRRKRRSRSRSRNRSRSRDKKTSEQKSIQIKRKQQRRGRGKEHSS